MDSIFHEKQEGSLCAQHCLNALLQGPYFTPVDLASLAQRMDDEERMRMAESGVDSEDYIRFIEQPSGNMDDSGYFSVQVISSALEVWGLDLVPFNSSEPLAAAANANPESMTAYICNYRDHWFTIRKLGNQWFNLNSLLSKPQLISTTYLSIFLAQLQQEGYSIFIVNGSLPTCTADEVLRVTPAVQEVKTITSKEPVKNQQDFELEKAMKLSLGLPIDKDEEELQAALQLSLEDTTPDPALNQAIQLSLQLNAPSTVSQGSRPSSNTSTGKDLKNDSYLIPVQPEEVEEDEELMGAIRLSLEGHEAASPIAAPSTPRVVNIPIQRTSTSASNHPKSSSNQLTQTTSPIAAPSTPRVVNIPIQRTSTSAGSVDIEEVRRRRLAFLDNKAATGS